MPSLFPLVTSAAGRFRHPLAVGLGVFLPGAGHLILGHTLRGLALFAVFGLAIDGVFLGLYGPVFGASADSLVLGAGLSAILLWGYGVYDVWRKSFGRLRDSLRTEKAKHFRAGLVHYLSDNLDEAIREFLFVLRLDDEDMDALFYLAMAQQRAGRHPKARRLFEKCQAMDVWGKWGEQIAEQLRQAPPRRRVQ